MTAEVSHDKDQKAAQDLDEGPGVPQGVRRAEEEFTVMTAIANARRRAGLSQAELARRMKTTQSTVARLESGRGQPSTRTLVRFAKATGHRLKISFQPIKGKG
jgi:ribosome-binding protein aMBF1 (putative translation factor)